MAIFYFIFQESYFAFEHFHPHSIEQFKVDNPAEVQSLSPEVYPANPMPTDDGEKDSTEAGQKASQRVQIVEPTIPEEIPVQLSDLIFPNDSISGKEAYTWSPLASDPKYSIVPLIAGSLKIAAIAIIIAAPIAILAAIFTIIYAPLWLQRVLKPSIEILAGFPTVVIGFFMLTIVATPLQELTGAEFRLNALLGGIGVSLAVIPIIYTIAEDALRAVPHSVYEGALSLGATRWQTAYRVILPAALGGVIAAVMLGVGRAIGETMIVLMVTGNAPQLTDSILESVRTVSATIGAEMGETEFRSVHYGVLFVLGAALFIVTFIINAIVEMMVRSRFLSAMYRG
ncbi:MAG: phosphate ABC transporter permease subunit PstC [Ectothiorhodospiraceae bacterium]|nr:phosphate ABC transporter permease subunit PstC [Ectothiorhodospiraceae bacterium]